MMYRCLILALSVVAPAFAQRANFEDSVRMIGGAIEPAEARPGQTVVFKVIVQLNDGYYTYPTVQPDQVEKASQNIIQVAEAGPLRFVVPVKDPSGVKTKKGARGALGYYPGGAVWEIPAVVSPTAEAGEHTVTLKQFRVNVCFSGLGKDDFCFPPKTVPISGKLKVSGSPVPVEEKYRDLLAKTAAPAPKEVSKQPDTASPSEPEKTVVSRKIASARDYAADMKVVEESLPPPQIDNQGFFVFLLAAVTWGIITLLTPCVFPMVPITVSVFLKQSEKSGTNPVIQAAVYATTIVIVLGVSALVFLGIFRDLSINPWMNVGLGLLFVVFSLSLFGMFDLTMPSWLVNASASREGGGYLGTVFMGLTFSLISFTCVAPFLGGFAGLAASGNFSFFQRAMGALAFALAFATPFFLLALFPSFLKKLPKSGGWLNTIKVVMGFLELGAAFKFFRTAELRWEAIPKIFTYDIVMAIWIAMLVAMGFYLLGLFRLPHDHAHSDHIGVPRLMFALLSLGTAVYLTPALFGTGQERNRPGGTFYAWVDAFLLPEPSAASGSGKGELSWSGDLRRSLDDARARGGYVFVDFTGETCTNCRLNEHNVFPQPAIRDLLKQYTLVQLYTDDVPLVLYDVRVDNDQRRADAQVNLAFQKARFGTEQLPLYVILKPEPGGKTTVVGVYEEGLINRVEAFQAFLERPLGK